MKKNAVVDLHGKPVTVGVRVRVISIPSGVLEKIETEEIVRVQSMVGGVFEVEEIDQHGCAWVTKWWETGAENKVAHSLALAAENMELV